MRGYTGDSCEEAMEYCADAGRMVCTKTRGATKAWQLEEHLQL